MGSLRRHVTFFEAYGHVYAGAQRIVHLLAEHLPNHGFTTDVVLNRDGPVAERIAASGVEVTVIPTARGLDHYGGSTTGARIPTALAALPSYWRTLAQHLRARRGLVHGCSQRSVILAAPAARLARARFVWQVSVLEEHRALSVLCDALAHHTTGLAGSVHVPSMRPWRDQPVIYPPLDPRLDDVPTPCPVDPPLVCSAGRLEPMKEFEVLLRAMVGVRQQLPGVRLGILGSRQEGHERYAVELEELRDDLGLSGAVDFLAFVDRPEEHWRDGAVYVQPSHLEGNSLAAMEAMASGLPVIVTSTTGNAEVVRDAVSGYVVPPNDDAALANALIKVLSDPALAARMGAEARHVARERYGLDHIVEQTATLYSSYLSR